MSFHRQVLAAWCGMLCPLVMFAGLIAGGLIPPLLPSSSAAEIAAIYQEHATSIRIGMIILVISAALLAIFVGGISAQMRRIETNETPVLTYVQMICGTAIVLFFVIPAMLWSVAAFRPERSPDTIQVLNDVGWFFFVMPFSMPVAQNFAIGLAILSDQSSHPVFPRWVGFFNFWVSILYVPGGLCTFFRTGPFAWNGLLAFWVPALAFGPWFYVMGIYMVKAARSQRLASG